MKIFPRSYADEDVYERRTKVSTYEHEKFTVGVLANRFSTDNNKSQETLHMTRQRGLRLSIFAIIWEYRENIMYQIERLNGKFATEKSFSPNNSIRQNKYYQLYRNKCGFYAPYHLSEMKGGTIGDMLSNFIAYYGLT